MGSFISKSNSASSSIRSANSSSSDKFESFDVNSVQSYKHIIKRQLFIYANELKKDVHALTKVEESFVPVANSSIINVMGGKQCLSYQKYKSFSENDLIIMRSICKIPQFSVDRCNSEVAHLIEPLREAYKAGSIYNVSATIERMKNLHVYKGSSFTTVDYRLLDILEYITNFCMKGRDNDSSNVAIVWTNIFDMLFRGTNIKLSNRKSRFALPKQEEDASTSSIRSQQLKSSNNLTKTSILFQCLCQNGFSQQEFVEIAACHISHKDAQASQEENQDNEAISQSGAILVNKSILEDLENRCAHISSEVLKGVYPVGIHITGYHGHLYTVRRYKGICVASQACNKILTIPQNEEEFEAFLHDNSFLEMLCNLKRHCINVAKVARQASSSHQAPNHHQASSSNK